MGKIKLVILTTLLSVCSVVNAAPEKHIIKFGDVSKGEQQKQVEVKQICVGGYMFVVAMSDKGVSIEQVFREYTYGTPVIPIKCNSSEM